MKVDRTIEAKIRLRYFSSAEELARAAAIELHGLLARHDGNSPFGIALSGGRIAKSFYSELVQSCGRSKVEFSEVHFFWADERCVPPLDPESNFSGAREYLFSPLQIASSQIHRILGELDPEEGTKQAEAELCRLMPLDADGQPVLDVVILGMGEDGHVASLFPSESAEYMEDSRVYRAVVATKPPPKRITLGYGTIRAAREVWVLSSGPGKKEIFEKFLGGAKELPISRVVLGRTETVLFEDIFFVNED
jgi:6-phosphogluconolactonase